MIRTNNSHLFTSPTASLPLSNNSSSISTTYYSQQTYKSYSPTTPPFVDLWLSAKSEDNRKSKRRKEMNSLMNDLNQDYQNHCERLYFEKSTQLDQELDEAKQDNHSAYLERLKDLEQLREKMIKDGELFTEYQNQVADDQFKLEIYQAEEEYSVEIEEIREKLYSIIEEKRKKLKEEKDNYDLSYDAAASFDKRTLRKRNNEQLENKSVKKKQQVATGPAFNFRLKDNDILTDLAAMKRNQIS